MSNDIDKLLEKYMEAETSVEEERVLRAYFAQDVIEERHWTHAPLFAYFNQTKLTEKQEHKEKTNTKSKTVRLKTIHIWASVAACLTVLLLATTWIYNTREVSSQSLVYIDGKKVLDNKNISLQALNSLAEIQTMDESILESQLNILDSFIEE